jgi:hypothetical protein
MVQFPPSDGLGGFREFPQFDNREQEAANFWPSRPNFTNNPAISLATQTEPSKTLLQYWIR